MEQLSYCYFNKLKIENPALTNKLNLYHVDRRTSIYKNVFDIIERNAFDGRASNKKDIFIPESEIISFLSTYTKDKKELTDLCEDILGLSFLKAKVDTEHNTNYYFVHPSFIDYFAARYLIHGLQLPDTNRHLQAKLNILGLKWNYIEISIFLDSLQSKEEQAIGGSKIDIRQS